MLKIGYGHPKDIYFYIDSEFEEMFELSWLDDPFNKRILQEIDNCKYNGVAMEDLTQGYTFSVYDISSGSKALMLVNELDEIGIWGTAFGDNCTDFLLELAEKKDVTIYLQHYMKFHPEHFKAYSLTQNKVYESYQDYQKELFSEVIKWT